MPTNVVSIFQCPWFRSSYLFYTKSSIAYAKDSNRNILHLHLPVPYIQGSLLAHTEEPLKESPS